MIKAYSLEDRVNKQRIVGKNAAYCPGKVITWPGMGKAREFSI
jgi:hypothetical protein